MDADTQLTLLLAAVFLAGLFIGGALATLLNGSDARESDTEIAKLERLLAHARRERDAATQERDAMKDLAETDVIWRDMQRAADAEAQQDFEEEGWKTDPEGWRNRRHQQKGTEDTE